MLGVSVSSFSVPLNPTYDAVKQFSKIDPYGCTGVTNKEWTRGTKTCAASLPSRENGQTVTIDDNSRTDQGTARYRCVNGTWSAQSTDCYTPKWETFRQTGCPGTCVNATETTSCPNSFGSSQSTHTGVWDIRCVRTANTSSTLSTSSCSHLTKPSTDSCTCTCSCCNIPDFSAYCYDTCGSTGISVNYSTNPFSSRSTYTAQGEHREYVTTICGNTGYIDEDGVSITSFTRDALACDATSTSTYIASACVPAGSDGCKNEYFYDDGRSCDGNDVVSYQRRTCQHCGYDVTCGRFESGRVTCPKGCGYGGGYGGARCKQCTENSQCSSHNCRSYSPSYYGPCNYCDGGFCIYRNPDDGV